LAPPKAFESKLVARFAVVVGLAILSGCAAPVGVERISPRKAQRDLTQSILSSDELSEKSQILLQRMDMEVLWKKDPAGVLAKLHGRLARPMDAFDAERRASALDSVAEIAFAYAEKSGDRRYYLAAALYAWLYLFPVDGSAPPYAVDRGVRLSADLYNRGIALAFLDPESGEVILEDGDHALPFGTLEVDFDELGLRMGDRSLSRFISVADLEVQGLNNRYRMSGLGAPLAARFSDKMNEDDPDPVFEKLRVPVTAVLRFGDLATQMLGDRITADLSVIAFTSASETEIDGHIVPLEAEPSAALALQLTETPPWQREIKGFFQGDLVAFERGMTSLDPYRPGRIPLVLVHGTASSAGRWADLVNDLTADPVVRRHYQIWLFSYNTGNPIAYSGWLLKKAIADLVMGLDPKDRSPALRDIVVMGHSQGGLLAKLQVVDSGEQLWDAAIDESPHQIKLEPASRELLEGSLLVRPSPYVKRVIFLSTPHHGSVLANMGLANLVGRAVRSPANLLSAVGELFSHDPEVDVQRRLSRTAGSIGNMSPSSPFIEVLAPLPIAPEVHAHSIMGVKKGPKEDGTDGVVSYRSAHLDDVESELVVASGHSSQSNPLVVREVRRILLEHLTQAIEAGIVEGEAKDGASNRHRAPRVSAGSGYRSVNVRPGGTAPHRIRARSSRPCSLDRRSTPS
jgi:hypothetical protein